MRIVHASHTPCAGAVYALSTAIEDHCPDHTSRFISNGGAVNNLHFPHDLTWEATEQFPLLARADWIVLHNGGQSGGGITTETEPFCDYLGGDPSKRCATFFHSHPGLMEVNDGLVLCPAQYQAVLWGDRAVPVRSVVRFDRSDFPKRKDRGDGKVRIGFSPTFRQSQEGLEKGSIQWHHSKGYDVTMEVLQDLEKRGDVDILCIEGAPYDMCLQLKSECDILIDEVVTGSYHRSSLEGLALGIPTIANLSPEVHGVMVRAAGANDVPIVHATMETLRDKLLWLVGMKKSDRRAMGDASRDWMVRHWHPRDIAKGFVETLESATVDTEVT